LQGIIDVETAQGKRLEALEHEISDLRDKVNTPVVNNYASSDDLQKLVADLKEIDKKRQQDRELILAKIEDLAKLGDTPPPTRTHHAAVHKEDTDDSTTATPDTVPDAPQPQKMYKYTVQAGDTLSAIAKAYSEKGVKVTVSQIEKANHGLTPKTLLVDKTILIPDFSK
jgi:nucleoid-associated protein YgaU